MNRSVLTAQYSQFTPEERFRLRAAAEERGDHTEIMRLWQSCPQMELVGPDPKFPQLLLRMWEAVCWLILSWTETSHLVVRDQLLTAGLELAGEAALAAKAKRSWREWSAAWKGIEAGLDRFCAEVDLPRAQLLAIGYPLSPVIEQARHLLDPDGRVASRYKDGVY